MRWDERGIFRRWVKFLFLNMCLLKQHSSSKDVSNSKTDIPDPSALVLCFLVFVLMVPFYSIEALFPELHLWCRHSSVFNCRHPDAVTLSS